MAPRLERSDSGGLRVRVISAAVMAPVALLAIWLDGWPFALLVAAASGLMYWEWHGMSAGGAGRERGMSWYAGIAGCMAGPVFLLFFGPNAAVFTGVGVAMLLAILLGVESSAHAAFRWIGFPYIFLSCVAMVWLRGLPAYGLATVLWVFAIVVATDTGAYFTGRTLGGPKLAPRISPKKTWSGLFGGVLAALLAGVGVALAAERPALQEIGLVSGGLAVVAQIGDLLMSKAKRRFSIKDSSNLIPGHGGALDRLDGFLAVSLVMAVLCAAGGGSALAWL